MTIGENIRRFRERAGMTQNQLAQKIGVSDRAISTWEIGTREPKMGSISKIAAVLGIKPSDIIDAMPDTIPIISARMIPVIAMVYAGINGVAQLDYQGEEPAYNISGAGEYYYFVVKGDSMMPDIHPGDLALVRLQDEVECGELAVCIVNGEEGVIKRIQRQKGAVVLMSSNPEYPPRVFVGKDMNEVKVWGRVMEVKRKY